ncbi:CheB methylesterase domain-containing protein [Alkalilacustris brevis]|uniref:CheB methylesterase domain-containing protein n=1 Tax=Alkalilacustris brevis TaxID=2026338 RepID=UPI0012D2DA56|nr:CheB methylesterase domain-containing protein [Alkalilacustris brevis]
MRPGILLLDQNTARRVGLARHLGGLGTVVLGGQAGSVEEAARLPLPPAGGILAMAPDLAAQQGFAALAARCKARGLRIMPYPDLPGDGGAAPEGRLRRLAQALARAAAPQAAAKAMATAAAPGPKVTQRLPVVCIGASTGGVPVLQEILGALPEDAPPIVIVQHIRGSFSASMADRLDRHCRITVMEAHGGAALRRGHAYVAPGDQLHLELGGRAVPVCRLVPGPPCTGHRPSVDRLFVSAAGLKGAAPIGVLLTGMGRDGAEGLFAIRRCGGGTIVQDSATSTVYGMPRAAVELGAAQYVLPAPMIAGAILKLAARMEPARTGGVS